MNHTKIMHTELGRLPLKQCNVFKQISYSCNFRNYLFETWMEAIPFTVSLEVYWAMKYILECYD